MKAKPKKELIIIISILVLPVASGSTRAYFFYKHRNDPQWLKDLNTGSKVQKTTSQASFDALGGTATNSAYKIESQKVLYLNNVVQGADSKTFKGIYYGIGKDVRSVYFGTSTVSVADVSNFEYMSFPTNTYSTGIFFKDSKNVYTCPYTCLNESLVVVPDADPQTFQPVSGEYLKDKQHVYYQTQHLPNDKYYIYLIPGAGPATFQAINTVYSRDKEEVFFKDKIVVNADPNTFVALDNNSGKDARNAFANERMQPEIDAATFVKDKSLPLWDDKNGKYYFNDHSGVGQLMKLDFDPEKVKKKHKGSLHFC